MSNQNPIHRDGGRRDNINESRLGAKETFSQYEADIERQAAQPHEQAEELTDEEQTELQEQTAAERFKEIGEDEAARDESAE
jgi:hypothetical protein